MRILRREALYDHIRRSHGKPLFSFAGKVTDKIVFLLPQLYEKALPGLDTNEISPSDSMWALVEHFFAPTVFIELVQDWQRGLGTELRGDTCWYLPVLSHGKKLKPIPRVLDSWLRVAGYRTAYGVSEEMGSPDLRRNVDRWRTGEVVPTLATLHNLVEEFAKAVSWLDEPDNWKARFTLGCAMQKLCDKMDEFFKDIHPESSLALAEMFRRVEQERIVCDDNKVLCGSRTFFAARLLQLRLQREGKWETQVLAAMPKVQNRIFPPDASEEQIAQGRQEMEWQSNPGNWFVEFIKRQSPPESNVAFEDYLFSIGVAELNRLFN
jgi:hypothetical protein